MIKKLSFATFAIIIHASGSVLAQQSSDVPDIVVETCMAQNDASRLPECLKEGAYGYHMLQLVSTADFYGDNAQPVIDSCKALNDTLQGAWTCFRVATEKAAETRSLVGLGKIMDRCVAAISDPDVFARLEGRAKEQRRVWFPGEMFSGGNFYHPFKGCTS